MTSNKSKVGSPSTADNRPIPKVNVKGLNPFPEQPPTAEELCALVGIETTDAAIGIIGTGLQSLSGESLAYRPFLLGMFAEEKPQTAIEAMLLVQLVGVHVQTMNLCTHADLSEFIEVKAALLKAMNNSGRTFLEQMMTLKKYRSKASQTVRIERVNVNEGGQAIIGDVSAKKGGGR